LQENNYLHRLLGSRTKFSFLSSKKVSVGLEAGLPDGLFSNQKSQFGQILEGLRWKNVAIFYDPLEYLMDIWDIL
jgi:hypothetical protein